METSIAEKPKVQPIIGRTKSGRVWKSTGRKPVHTMTSKKVSTTTWKKKMEAKRDALATKVFNEKFSKKKI